MTSSLSRQQQYPFLISTTTRAEFKNTKNILSTATSVYNNDNRHFQCFKNNNNNDDDDNDDDDNDDDNNNNEQLVEERREGGREQPACTHTRRFFLLCRFPILGQKICDVAHNPRRTLQCIVLHVNLCLHVTPRRAHHVVLIMLTTSLPPLLLLLLLLLQLSSSLNVVGN